MKTEGVWAAISAEVNSAEAREKALESLQQALESDYSSEDLTQDPEFISEVATPQELARTRANTDRS